MPNPWLRLWVDMPNDPKWRTIARISNQEISRVISVYVHMMVCASNATERGRTEGWSDEDIATALDIETDDVVSIREAMQGRVLDGDFLAGWDKRQPKREDGSADRSKAWRNAKKSSEETQSNAIERNRALDKIREEENRLDKKKSNTTPDSELFDGVNQQIVEDFKTMRAKQRAPITKTAIDGIKREALKAGVSFQDALQLCVERNWRAVKADWLLQPSRGSPQGYESTRDKSRREAMEKLTGKKSNGQPDFIDIN